MPIDDPRTCPKCRSDEHVRHVTTRHVGRAGWELVYRCTDCRIEFSARLGGEERPFFGSPSLQDVA